ncbi:MAG: NAD-dependent epimerase/dehydratase family protein [Oscillospiraceae bacterium]|nr:NAD-dependent epimerase/dehydratase family protein [Oscillospiraceae bacterium]
MKKVLVTGANGFIGRNFCCELSRFPDRYALLRADVETSAEQLREYLGACDVVVHFAGVNRPKDDSEFRTGNAGFTGDVVSELAELGNAVPVVMTSSVQAAFDNPYGRSKREGEEVLFSYGRVQKVPVYVFRLPNVFGKWCRPNYNSAVATFCYNIARGLPIQVNEPERIMTLVYIDDVVAAVRAAVDGELLPRADGYCYVPTAYTAPLQYIADKIAEFRAVRDTLVMPALTGLDKALYSTYLSYLPTDAFAYAPVKHADARGLFAELFKTAELGQFSVSTTAPGITRGNHWHHTKTEKFIVVSGEASTRLRKIDETGVVEYRTSGETPTVIDIPPGYTHSITNTSADRELVTLIWANEPFDPARPDTYPAEV